MSIQIANPCSRRVAISKQSSKCCFKSHCYIYTNNMHVDQTGSAQYVITKQRQNRTAQVISLILKTNQKSFLTQTQTVYSFAEHAYMQYIHSCMSNTSLYVSSAFLLHNCMYVSHTSMHVAHVYLCTKLQHHIRICINYIYVCEIRETRTQLYV